MFEVLSYYADKIDASDVLERLGLEKYDYFVVSAHREENVDSDINLEKLVTALNELAQTYMIKKDYRVHSSKNNVSKQHEASSFIRI